MSIWKRAVLYLTRKKGRTIFLFFYMFGIACFLFVAIFLNNGAEKELKNLRRTFGAGFVLSRDDENEACFINAEFNGKISKVYNGPIITDELIEKIMEIQGVTDYTLSNREHCVWTDLKIRSGAWAGRDHPDMITSEQLELYRQGILIYPCRNGERHINFSTGAFEISGGRNLVEGDCYKAVISEEMAERNGLSIGDMLTIETKEGYVTTSATPAKTWGKPMDLQVIGLFHMNFSQQASDYTYEDEYFENNIYVDMETDQQFTRNIEENWDVDLPREGYLEVTFFVDDPVNLDAVMQEVEKREDIEGLKFYVDYTAYQSSAKSYSRIRIFAMSFLVIGVSGAATVLFLLVRLWIRGRKHEIGIMISIGIKKGEVVCQILTEYFMISIAALIVTLFLSGILAGMASYGAKRLTANKEQGNYRVTMDQYHSSQIELTSIDKADLSNEVTLQEMLWLIFFINGISAGSVLLASDQILKSKPGELLQLM